MPLGDMWGPRKTAQPRVGLAVLSPVVSSGGEGVEIKDPISLAYNRTEASVVQPLPRGDPGHLAASEALYEENVTFSNLSSKQDLCPQVIWGFVCAPTHTLSLSDLYFPSDPYSRDALFPLKPHFPAVHNDPVATVSEVSL